MKIDATGSKQWEKVTGGLYKQYGTVYLAASPDHAILQGYSYTQHIDWDYNEWSTVTIQKFRENGDSVFTLQLNPQVYEDKYFSAFICDEYGSIYCCGKDEDYSSKTWIFKANSSGDSLWFKNYLSLLPNAGDSGHQHFLDCILNPEANSLLFFGSIWLKNNSGYSWVLGTDSTGNFDTANFVRPFQRLPELDIYPNPCKSAFRVNLPMNPNIGNSGQASAGLLEVTDITGRIMESIEIPANIPWNDIQCNNWARGVYILSLKSNGKVLRTGKVLRD
ncbi:MAG: T9SS type A sorting domain-containing protein [Bacteroidales bacterium]|nr:T9SS type A sorting domain-containing protein [Bacteroidales bacterium]